MENFTSDDDRALWSEMEAFAEKFQRTHRSAVNEVTTKRYLIEPYLRDILMDQTR